MKKRYQVTQGAYAGTSDDCIGRYYIDDTESTVVDRRGPGMSKLEAEITCIYLNEGHSLAEAQHLAACDIYGRC